MTFQIVEIRDIELEVVFNYYPGFVGNDTEPPEEPEYDFTNICVLYEETDIIPLLSKEVFIEISQRLEELRKDVDDDI
jgi:hypothetical protein